MRVLIGCATSCVALNAFLARGHDAWQCDLLPDDEPTNRLTPPKPGADDHKAWSMIHRAPPGPDRWKIRSKTFAGMAEAWADQYGNYALEQAA
jgi:hypothetical protein